MTVGYHHLVGLEDQRLRLDDCIYLDGIRSASSIIGMTDLVVQWFGDLNFQVRQVVIGERGESASKVRSLGWLLGELASTDGAGREEWSSIQFFPSRRTTVEETWQPDVYFGVEIKRHESSIFISVKSDLGRGLGEDVATGFLNSFAPCAAYIFEFPTVFSPLAYFWGITVMPANRRWRYGHREEERLAIFRDNSRIGLGKKSRPKLFGACEGFVRDVYPKMYLSEVHLKRMVGGISFEDFAKAHCSISSIGRDYRLLTIDPSRLGSIQRMWDDNDLTLSSRRRAESELS